MSFLLRVFQKEGVGGCSTLKREFGWAVRTGVGAVEDDDSPETGAPTEVWQ